MTPCGRSASTAAHHAKDDIARLIEDGELDELRLEVKEKMQGVLRALVIDTDHAGPRKANARDLSEEAMRPSNHRELAAPIVRRG